MLSIPFCRDNFQILTRSICRAPRQCMIGASASCACAACQGHQLQGVGNWHSMRASVRTGSSSLGTYIMPRGSRQKDSNRWYLAAKRRLSAVPVARVVRARRPTVPARSSPGAPGGQKLESQRHACKLARSELVRAYSVILRPLHANRDDYM